MSIIFGVCNVQGQIVDRRQLERLAHATERYALDGTVVRAEGRIGMGFQPYHTHVRSQFDAQPIVDGKGNMLTFDGRLDNHLELCQLLDIQHKDTPDSLIVLAAFMRWGEDCFSRFIGDWALALWSNANRSLYLARDHAGTRTLYFEQKDGRILWSTYLETFFVERDSRDLDKGFAARYLACQPIGNLTPYSGIGAVMPAHYFVFCEGKLTRKAHWQWMVKDTICYRTDAEYEEHFLSLFRQSVVRRTGRGAPIIAQLSGGMDSSAIVCMSDCIRKGKDAEPVDLLDTVSFHDDSDPDWNEAPYFSCVEETRNKAGLHIPFPLFGDELQPAPVSYLWPGATLTTYENELRFDGQTASRGYRAILSGIGGDELLGGVPNPLPELADYLVSGRLSAFASRAVDWCQISRAPLVRISADAAGFLFLQYFPPSIKRTALPPWSTPAQLELLRATVHFEAARKAFCRISPSSIANGNLWWALLETLPHLSPGYFARREYRYPYLDRDLVEFLFRVPRERLLQPGRRRSMMRASLRGIVPGKVLERRRKAFRSRSAINPLRSATDRITSLMEHSSAAALGLVEQTGLAEAIRNAIHDDDRRWVHAATRLILFELWHDCLRSGAPTIGEPLRTTIYVA